jgi:hypothetical protein
MKVFCCVCNKFLREVQDCKGHDGEDSHGGLCAECGISLISHVDSRESSYIGC